MTQARKILELNELHHFITKRPKVAAISIGRNMVRFSQTHLPSSVVDPL
jgi:hypothetical protein